jgi:hypothetical protein
MAFKAGFVFMAPDGDPKRHRASIKTSKPRFNTWQNVIHCRASEGRK